MLFIAVKYRKKVFYYYYSQMNSIQRSDSMSDSVTFNVTTLTPSHEVWLRLRLGTVCGYKNHHYLRL